MDALLSVDELSVIDAEFIDVVADINDATDSRLGHLAALLACRAATPTIQPDAA